MDVAIGTLAQMSLAAPQALLMAGAVTTLLCFEVPRRVADIRVADYGAKECARSAIAVLCRCAPEVIGFLVVLCMGAILRLRGDVYPPTDLVETEVWERIKVEWPILMGADTLLNLQAMIRLLVVLFVAYRADADRRSPLTGMAALLSLAGALVRGILSTKTDVYRLEGPLALGGDLPVACEVASIPFLAKFGLSEFKRSPITASLMVSGALWFASHHYLNLAKDASVDRLFLQAHVLEFLAAFAYLFRAICLMVDRDDEYAEGGGRRLGGKGPRRCGAFVGFMHILMTLQQAFSAYYFLTAFEPHPGLVGSGRPFCVLCGGNLLQLGAYLGATALFIGGCVDTEASANALPAAPAAPEVDQVDAPADALPDAPAAPEVHAVEEEYPKSMDL
jgi:hypothetical protein